jgi:DNA-binding winged helix-turn-helix (wHTH) protein
MIRGMDISEARFDGWCVRFDSGEVIRGAERRRLAEQPLRVLGELLRKPGAVVTREELIGALWPTGVVEFDTSLNSAVRKLRRALGDGAGVPRYIETLPRRGYRFIGVLESGGRRAGDRLPDSVRLAAEPLRMVASADGSFLLY